MIQDGSSTVWICQTCKQPISTGDGFIEVINCNSDLGPIGSYPREATPPFDLGTEESGGAKIGDLVAELLQRKPYIGFLVFHTRCDPYPDTEGYSIQLARAETLEEWCGWVLHLFEKTWMSRGDLERMLEFWWSHKGDERPNT
ncbi:MAG: hypothetical protein AABN34_18560 [Acidobacteriota bacterium]